MVDLSWLMTLGQPRRVEVTQEKSSSIQSEDDVKEMQFKPIHPSPQKLKEHALDIMTSAPAKATRALSDTLELFENEELDLDE